MTKEEFKAIYGELQRHCSERWIRITRSTKGHKHYVTLRGNTLSQSYSYLRQLILLRFPDARSTSGRRVDGDRANITMRVNPNDPLPVPAPQAVAPAPAVDGITRETAKHTQDEMPPADCTVLMLTDRESWLMLSREQDGSWRDQDGDCYDGPEPVGFWWELPGIGDFYEVA
jgi:hypothetical protein